MTQEKSLIPPQIKWAQEKDQVFMKICLPDCKDPTITIDSDKIYFKGVGGTDHTEHEVTINLFGEILSEKTKKNFTGLFTELTLYKKDNGSWKRLTKEGTKFHWLVTDFDKYKDEDDSESEFEPDKDMRSIFETPFNADAVGQISPVDSEDDLPEGVSPEDVLPDLE